MRDSSAAAGGRRRGPLAGLVHAGRPYRYCQRYAYTGTDQTFTVPGGVTSIRVLEWGAGGGGASAARPQFSAGAGGFTGGWGGGLSGAGDGGNGQVVIEWGCGRGPTPHPGRPAGIPLASLRSGACRPERPPDRG